MIYSWIQARSRYLPIFSQLRYSCTTRLAKKGQNMMDESKTATNPEVTLTSVAHTSRDRKVINWRFIGGFWYGALRYFVANKQIEKERFSLFYVFREACLTPPKKKRNLCPTKGRSRSTKNDCALWKYHSLYRIQNTVFNVFWLLHFVLIYMYRSKCPKN